MKTGLYIGRFQPFHLGHLSAIKQALGQVDFLKIGIGSAQYQDQPENPYSAELREKMIRGSLEEAGISKDQYEIFLISDIHDNPKWTAHVKSIVGSFDALLIGNKGIVNKLFDQYEKVPIVMIKKEVDISATEIRERMKLNKSIKEFLTQAVRANLEKQ